MWTRCTRSERDAEGQAYYEPQAAAVEQLDHEQVDAAEVAQRSAGSFWV